MLNCGRVLGSSQLPRCFTAVISIPVHAWVARVKARKPCGDTCQRASEGTCQRVGRGQRQPRQTREQASAAVGGELI